jgi:uncharacterized protein YuzE
MIDRDVVLDAVQDILKFPSKQIWMDYDEGADVLYLSFRKPQNASDSEMEEDIIYHYDEEELVGLTILNARDRDPEN